MQKTLNYKIAVLVFILPALILFTVFVCYPILQTVFRSFYEWDGLNTPKFIQFDNYKRIVQDSDFILATKNGFIFAGVLVVYQIGLGTVLAMFLANRKLHGAKFFKTTYFIPVVLSITVVCQLWLAIYHSDYGLLNNFFKLMGSDFKQSWLSGKNTAIFAVAAVNAWQYMGIHLVLIYAAIKSIPEHYYEAALIDGANTFTAHRRITLPLLSETYKFCLIIAITGGFKAFENMYIMTNGGPGNLTYTTTFFMYSKAFRANEYGYACTSAALLVLQCLLVTLLINRFVARERITY